MEVPGAKAGLIDILDHYTMEIAKKEAPKRVKKSNPLRPSSAGKCARELAFEYMIFKGDLEVPPVIEPPNTQRLLKLGHSLEYHMVGEFKKAFAEGGGLVSIKYGQQVVRILELQDGSFIEGQIDGLFYAPEWRTLVDFKTKKDKFSEWRKTNWDEDGEWLANAAHQFSENGYYIDDLDTFLNVYRQDKPFLCYNFYQLNLYFHEKSGFFKEIGVDNCSLLYYNKNDSRMREIRFKPSQLVAEKTKERYLLAEKAVVEKDIELAPREFSLGGVKCAFCNFQEMCWGLDAKKEYFKTFPKKQWPKDVDRMENQEKIEELYFEYTKAKQQADCTSKIEQQLIVEITKSNAYKVKFSNGDVYEVKDYKTGGVRNGPRKALKRAKL